MARARHHAGFRAAALDFRSHGRSDRVYEPEQCTAAVLAADVAALLDHLTVDRADIVGFSMGGGVALQAAMDYPERTRRLVVGGVGAAALNRLHDPNEIAALIAAFEVESSADVESANATCSGREFRRREVLNPRRAGGARAATLAAKGATGDPGARRNPRTTAAGAVQESRVQTTCKRLRGSRDRGFASRRKRLRGLG